MKNKLIAAITSLTLFMSSFSGITVYATEQEVPDPIFTIQYYAYTENIRMVDLESVGQNAYSTGRYLPVVDTSGGKLPTNGNSYWARTYDNFIQSPNGNTVKAIALDNRGKIINSPWFNEIYTSRDLEFRKYPHIGYFDLDSNNYRLSEVWVAKEGTLSDDKDSDNWYVYYLAEDENRVSDKILKNGFMIPSFDIDEGEVQTGAFQLTNDPDLDDPEDKKDFDNPENEGGDGNYYVYVTDNTIIRLVYIPTETEISVGNTKFYDYDITEDGKTTGNKSDIVNARGNGINTDKNFQGKNGARFVFGNGNSGTGMWEEFWNGTVPFNRANRFSYGLSAYGLVSGLNKDGTLKWSEGIAAPDLFNETTNVHGKYTYDDFSMIFKQKGDTFTFSKLNKGNDLILNNLDELGADLNEGIFSNAFWPFDNFPHNDGLVGGIVDKDGNQLYDKDGNPALSTQEDTYDKNGNLTRPYPKKFTGYGAIADVKHNIHKIGSWGTDYISSPISDNKISHNNYFGMSMEVEFMTEADYKGPIEYVFYGDDDLWVFLSKMDEEGNYTDAKLICDLGGVKPSTGQYVNLRDYVGYDSTGMWKLNIFYTERGASGSTCWMQFTLPSLHLSTVEETHFDIDIDAYNKLETTREYDDKEKIINLFDLTK